MKKVLHGLGVLLIALLLWQILAMIVAAPMLPYPIQVLRNLAGAISGSLPLHIAYSLARICISVVISIIVGIPLGIAIGYSPLLNRLLSPFLYLSYPIPKLALLPIIMLLFGLGESSKVIMIFLILFFPITVDIAGSVRAMDKEIFQTMKAFGVGGPAIARKIILPGILPAILDSLKVSIGIALSILFFAENYGTRYGLGYHTMNSWQKMDYLDLYSGIFALSILGFILFLLLDFIYDRVTAWR
jgi:NitT/TauT family transport system permease protein